MKRIKILVITGRLDIGGTEKHLLNIFPHLVKNFDISIFPLKTGGLLENEFKKRGLNIICGSNNNSKFGLFISIFNLFFYSIKNKPDIIHFFLPKPYLIGMFATVFSFKSKKIMSRRSLNNYQEKHLIFKYIEYKLHKYIDFALGNSKPVIKQLIDEKIERSKLGLIYNGIDIPERISVQDKIELKKKYNLNSKTLVFIVVANLIPYKGHIDIIDALSILKNDMPYDWRIFFVGKDYGIKKKLEKLVRKNSLSDFVIWTGEVIEPDDYYKISDVGISASHQEGFSNSLLEGMSYRLTMIASDAGGNRYAIIDGDSGLIIPPNCPEEMVKKIKYLVDNIELKERMGEAAHKRVKELFNKDKCIQMYRILYSSVYESHKLPEEIKYTI